MEKSADTAVEVTFPPDRFHVPKTEWGDGPWQSEPDKAEWRSKDGIPCLIVRGASGALCGYAACPPGHPWHGQKPNDLDDVSIHGGLTYGGLCQEERQPFGVCHVARPGEPDHVWWLGFDCAHSFDLSPGLMAYIRLAKQAAPKAISEQLDRVGQDIDMLVKVDPGMLFMTETYKSFAYVREQVEELAAQIAERARG